MRRALLSCSLLASLLVSASALAQVQPAAAAPPAASPHDALITRLQSTIVDADFDRVDLEKVIDDLRTRYNLNIHISWNALEAAGIRRDQRIEIHLKQVALATLIDLILRDAAGSAQPPQFLIQSGIIVITTQDLAREQTVLRTYDITDLVESGYALRRFAITPVLALSTTGREFLGGEKPQAGRGGVGGGGSGSGGGGGGGLFNSTDSPVEPSRMERAQIITDLIQDNIEPESWRALGGDQGALHLYNNTLFISHSLRVHQQIAEFLALIRATKPAPLTIDAAVVRLRADRAAELRKTLGESFPRISSDAADQLAFSPQSEGVLFRATSAGYNGQRALFSALSQRSALTGLTPLVAQGSAALSPLTSDITSGLELIVLPLLAPDAQSLALDVQLAWSPSPSVAPRPINALALHAAPAPVAPSDPLSASIDLSQHSMRTVSSTTSINAGSALALSIPAQLDDRNTAIEYEDILIIRARHAH